MVGRGPSSLKYCADASCIACHIGSSGIRPDTSAWVCTSIATMFFMSIFAYLPLRQVHLLPFLLLEHTAQDFPGRIPGNGFNEFHLAHILIGGELSIDPHHQFIRALVLITCSEHYKGFGHFSCLLTRLGDDCRVGNGGMLEQQRFDLGRGNTE